MSDSPIKNDRVYLSEARNAIVDPPVPSPRMRTTGSKRRAAYLGEEQYPNQPRPTHTYRGARRVIAKQMARRMGVPLKAVWTMLNS